MAEVFSGPGLTQAQVAQMVADAVAALVIPAASLLKHVSSQVTPTTAGTWTGSVPKDLVWSVQPTTTGEFANSITMGAVVGNNQTVTIAFRKFKSGGLGITLGTLLSVEAFEATPGVVNFNMFGSAASP